MIFKFGSGRDPMVMLVNIRTGTMDSICNWGDAKGMEKRHQGIVFGKAMFSVLNEKCKQKLQ